MMGISYSQLMIVLVVAVVLFGSRLPDVLRQLGRAYAQFRKGLNDLQYSLEDPEPPRYPARSNPRLSGPANSSSTAASAGVLESVDPGEEDFGRNAAPRFSPPPARIE
jgi:TatA/E family protein of Tat protein translocase